MLYGCNLSDTSTEQYIRLRRCKFVDKHAWQKIQRKYDGGVYMWELAFSSGFFAFWAAEVFGSFWEPIGAFIPYIYPTFHADSV